MKKMKMLLSAGTAVAAIAGVMAMTATPAMSNDKPAIEVITHAGAGGGTDVNARMMMIRTRRALKQDMVVVNKRGGGGAAGVRGGNDIVDLAKADGYSLHLSLYE